MRAPLPGVLVTTLVIAGVCLPASDGRHGYINTQELTGHWSSMTIS